jgi:hypothetical protein
MRASARAFSNLRALLFERWDGRPLMQRRLDLFDLGSDPVAERFEARS